MLSVQEAIDQLLASATPMVEAERVPLYKALGRVLASPVISGVSVPPADNSAMDGYALRHADWPGTGDALPVGLRIPAGQVPGVLPPGEAARIFTGAEIPCGADTVVMQEHTREAGDGVVIEKLPAIGANIRPCGQDIQDGQEILPAGKRLRAQELGLLASAGQGEAEVIRRLRVAIISNGDELVDPSAGSDAGLGPGQIFNSNRYLLQGLVDGWGFEALDLGIAPDDPEKIAALFTAAAEQADVILSSGGVSVGEEDHVKAVVERLGRLDLWKIAMKPGKPLAFGHVGDTPFIGLPGNPASALVTTLVVARPFLFACQGRSKTQVDPVRLTAAFSQRGSPRQEYLRVRRSGDRLTRYENQSSGVLLSACWGDGLAVQPPDTDIGEGDELSYLSYLSLMG